MIRRIPRKLKKKLKKAGVNTAKYLQELKEVQQRNSHLNKIFDKDYEKAHEIIQNTIGL